MEAIIKKLPDLTKIKKEDMELNIFFFYQIINTITSFEGKGLRELQEELDSIFHTKGENTLRKIIFMYGWCERGLVIVTKYNYENIVLVEGDTSFIYEAETDV